MPTLKELLESDMGASEKTAAANNTDAGADDVSIEKIALSLGLFADTEKVAEDDDKDDKDDKKEEKKEEKTASTMTGLFNALFPEDAPAAAEKTASEKVAESEEARGARTFEHFSDRFDSRIEKLATGVLSGGSVHKDAQPTNHFPNNKAPDGAINTKTTHTEDNVKAKNDAATVGHFEQKHASAVRKHLLLSQLES